MADTNPVDKTNTETKKSPKLSETSDTIRTLEDEMEPGQNANFVGATLEINGASTEAEKEPNVEFAGTVKRSVSEPSDSPNLNRNRPGSTIGRTSNISVGSRTSASNRIVTSDTAKGLFFSKKPGAFENAVEWCRGEILKSDVDGELRGAWLLSEIDHWDHEREKTILITDKTIVIVSYDYVTAKMKMFKRIGLQYIHTVQFGDFTYPPKSLMAKIHPRDHGGVRFSWGAPENLTFGQRWNPLASDMPETTFCHHPLLYNPKENETVTYNVDDFYESLLQAVRRSLKELAPERSLVVKEEPILIESYFSVSSLIFNQSHLGFNKDRNGVSF